MYLMRYTLLTRAVVTKTQQGLSPLLNIHHLEVIRALCTDQAYGNHHMRLKKKGSSKTSKYRCQSSAMKALWSQDTARTKVALSQTKRRVPFGSVHNWLESHPKDFHFGSGLSWTIVLCRTNTPTTQKIQNPACKYRRPPRYCRSSGLAQSHKETQNKCDKRCKNEASRWMELTP